MIQTKEQLLKYLLSAHIRLHYSDRKFFTNLSIIINNANQITTGQGKLFDRLVDKYSSQVVKTTLTTDQLLALPWESKVIETSSEYTSARISLVENELIIKVPTNNKFIRKFESLPNNPFTWDRQRKAYVSLASTYSLKFAKEYITTFFKEVRYCNNIVELLEKVESLNGLVWDPTLVKINNIYYIVAINETLGTLIENIELSNDPKTLFKLSSLGIKTNNELITSDFHDFAANFNAEVDTTKLNVLGQWIKDLGTEKVILGRGVNDTFNRTASLFRDLFNSFTFHNIQTISPSTNDMTFDKFDSPPMLIQYHGNDNMRFYSKRAVAKCVFIRNINPIEVK